MSEFVTLISSTYTPMISVAGVEFMDVLNEVVALIPAVLPAVIGFLALRKGWGFLKSAIKGA